MTPSSLPYPLSAIVSDVQRAYDQKLYYPALAVALTLPEICVALTFDSTMFVKGEHYANFIDTFTTQPELGLDGISCYRLRGGVIHRANAAGHPFFGATHVVFTVPESNATLHAFGVKADGNTATMFDLKLVIDAMISAVIRWYEKNKAHPKVIENLPLLISWRPNGLPPFLEGRPVIGSGK
jgi:hypothetical protein